MTDEYIELMSRRMELGWVVACSRCKSERVVARPDHLPDAVKILRDEGWTVEEVENTSKALAAPFLDTSGWSDTYPYVRCPECSGSKR